MLPPASLQIQTHRNAHSHIRGGAEGRSENTAQGQVWELPVKETASLLFTV